MLTALSDTTNRGDLRDVVRQFGRGRGRQERFAATSASRGLRRDLWPRGAGRPALPSLPERHDRERDKRRPESQEPS
ncbi:hypothetical protein JCM10369A_42750 [Nocardioides pyridinolyticus]